MNRNAISPNNSILLTCEHASRDMKIYGDEMSTWEKELLNTHWGSDPGAVEAAESLAKKLECMLVICKFSRLIIDPNRALSDEELILKEIEGHELQVNKDCDEYERIAKYYTPYRLLVSQAIKILKPKYHIAIHSFTNNYPGAPQRPYYLGVQFPSHSNLAQTIIHKFLEEKQSFRIQEPYDLSQNWDTMCDFIRCSTRKYEIETVTIELRNDMAVESEFRELVTTQLALATKQLIQIQILHSQNFYIIEHLAAFDSMGKHYQILVSELPRRCFQSNIYKAEERHQKLINLYAKQ